MRKLILTLSLLSIMFFISSDVFCQNIANNNNESDESTFTIALDNLKDKYGPLKLENDIKPEHPFIVVKPVLKDQKEKYKLTNVKENKEIPIDYGIAYNESSQTLIYKYKDISSALKNETEHEFNLHLADGSDHKITFSVTKNTAKTESVTTPPNSGSVPDIQLIHEQATRYAEKKYKISKFFSGKNGMYLKDNTVHIFIDENGLFIKTSTPTAAQENYTYQVHLFVRKGTSDKFVFSYEGEYEPQFNIYQVPSTTATVSASSGAAPIIKTEIAEIELPIIGPFTDQFRITLIRQINGQPDKILIDQTIKVAKVYHASIQTGIYSTWLKEPQNITILQKPNGKKTLVADDPTNRGITALMAVFYPKPRSFLFVPDKPWGWERLGIIAGTQINENRFRDLLFGLQLEFARGGSIAAGVHYGRHTIVVDSNGHKKDFKFGEDTFAGSLENRIRQGWDANAFLGINIDLRIIKYFIQSN